MQCDRQRVFKLGGGVLPLLRDFSLKRCWPDCVVSRQSRSTHSDTAKAPEQTDGCKRRKALDIVAERLRRWTANPLGSPRVGSNPIDVGYDITRKEPMPIEYFLPTVSCLCFYGSIEEPMPIEYSLAPDEDDFWVRYRGISHHIVCVACFGFLAVLLFF
jgi:hypothetical protein